MIGRKLANRYQILEKIGGGGMAIVYKGRCTLLNRIVAVKVLRPQFAHDEEFVKKFRREAQSSASLSHPNIVAIYDVGQDKSDYFIVMEYVEGMTLKEYIQNKGVLEPKEAMKIAKEVAEALAHAHDNSIIHRDIKPHNILLTKNMSVKVTDFGIAKAITSNTLTVQNTGSIMGSVHYFSPEQAKGAYAGVQSDIYSLGIVMYEMLTGQLPFDGESPISIAIKHIQEKVKPIREIKPDIPEDVAKIVEKCLQKNKDVRYNNIRDLLDDIQSWLKYGKVDVKLPETTIQQTQVFNGISVQTPVEEKKEINQNDKKKKIKKGILITSIVLLLIALPILAYFGIKNLLHVPEVVVPNVEGLRLNDAIAILKEKGLNYTITEDVYHAEIPVNHVVYQHPIPNTKVKKGREIALTLSSGPEFVAVPDVVGEEERIAKITIEQRGLKVNIERENSETVLEGRVIRQIPLGGNLLKGETVTLIISSGPRSVELPNLIGLTVEEAKELLSYLNISVRFVTYEPSQGNSPSGIVIRHSHQDNPLVQPGHTSIDLVARPFQEKTRTFTINNSDIEKPYVLKVIVKDLGGQRTVFENTVNPQNGDLEIMVNYWEKGEVEFYRDNELKDKILLP
ncbi:serine/threonine protein kinase [Anaerobranca californiensis DSM 14826]|uniref:non-specific serine/threonine protein kinase n=1 Tax=Anaerobranca californiensis DSM 14826 TaxID=1120989 RepID=A0A1M6KQA6_9FIRM|nr:Stk1 family PASTA domain-containing Ser/Thr kinase [Anaerobranca californiensis]SHJ61095.1 serine/threonine protein kinase [Anaerobranca californiensis DSM 14826]